MSQIQITNMKKKYFIVLLLVTFMLYSCSERYYGRQFYYNWCDTDSEYGTIYGRDYDNERKFDSTYYVSDSLSGVFLGIKGKEDPLDLLFSKLRLPTFKNPCVEVCLQLNNDGTSLFSESFGIYRGNGYGKWCVKDSMMYLICDGRPHLYNKLDSMSNVAGRYFRFRYKEIDIKILDKNRLQLKNGTVLFRQ